MKFSFSAYLFVLFFLPWGNRNVVSAQKNHVFYSVEAALKSPNEVYILDISDQGITALPNQIGLLKNLRELLAGGNQLQSLPEDICKLTRLEILYLPNNKIFRLPEQIGNLKRLKEITQE